MTPADRSPEGHEAFDALAVGWALHALEPEDEDAFAAHLAGCDHCARTVAETHAVMADLAAELPPAEPSESLRHRLRAAVEETEQLPAPDRPGPVPPAAAAPPSVAPPSAPVARPAERAAARHPVGGGRPVPVGDLRPPRPLLVPDARPLWRRVLPHALVAAAVAAVLALGAWNVVLAGDRDAAQVTAAEQQQVIDALMTPGRAAMAPIVVEGRSVATVVAREGTVQVVTTGLPVNDTDDSTYVAWGMGQGAPVPLGTFDVVSPRMDVRTVGSAVSGLDGYTAYAISREPGRTAPVAPSEIVARGEVDS